jgi:hypothetical protein
MCTTAANHRFQKKLQVVRVPGQLSEAAAYQDMLASDVSTGSNASSFAYPKQGLP